LLRAACPAGIPQGKWEKHLANLRLEEQWDHEVFDLIQQQKPAPVFLVSEDLRLQVRYWKDRRNDCAHFKVNEIDHSHVESFWNFIFSNIGKFVPNGSAAALLNEIVLYFDPNFTPPNAPLDPIIERIPNCVERDELTQFFKAVALLLSTATLVSNFEFVRDVNRVFDAVIRSANDSSINALREFLVTNEKYFVSLLREFPQHVILLDQIFPTVVRCLWRKHLFSDDRYGRKDITVFAAMLRAGLIPQEEIAEANTIAVMRLKGNIPSQIDIQILDQCGFFDVFKRTVFEDMQLNDLKWWRGNEELVCWYLKSYPITTEIVRSIYSAFIESNRYSWGVCYRLIELFKDNLTKRHEFEKIAQQEQLALPEAIFGE
jgi:hypothetical protein